MKYLFRLSAAALMVAAAEAQTLKSVPASAPPTAASASLEAHLLEIATPQQRYAVFDVTGAEGSLFVAMVSFGPFDPNTAFVIGVGRLDAQGAGKLIQPVTTAPLPPDLELEAGIVYLSSGQHVSPSPTVLRVGASSHAELLDFDYAPGPNPAKGQVIDAEYGLTGVTVSAVNNAPGKAGTAIIFDGENPSGEDPDLVTPNQDQVLIIAEDLVDSDGDGFVDDPDDEVAGGSLILTFDDPVEITSFTVVDIDFDETASARFTLVDGSTSVQPIASMGDGVVQTLLVSETGVVKMELVLSSSGGLVDVAIVPCPYLVNFDQRTFGTPLALQTGEVITDQFADIGLTISAVNGDPTHPNKAILFDSENPTGGDPDLMTPGYGANNTTPLGKLLIIAENDVDANGDGYVDDPDDEAAGGLLIFDFEEDVLLYGFTILDVDGSEFDFFEAFDASGGLIGRQRIPIAGDNSVTQFVISPPLEGVRQVVLNLDGSGAVTRLRFCPEDSITP